MFFLDGVRQDIEVLLCQKFSGFQLELLIAQWEIMADTLLDSQHGIIRFKYFKFFDPWIASNGFEKFGWIIDILFWSVLEFLKFRIEFNSLNQRYQECHFINGFIFAQSDLSLSFYSLGTLSFSSFFSALSLSLFL